MSADRRNWKPLPPPLKAAVAAFDHWTNAFLSARDARDQIVTPLYHYTDAAGLEGIVKTQQVWSTDFTHLNDPSELTYGMAIASELLSEIGQASDSRTRIFCDMVNDLFTHKNMRGAFGFFVSSFSQERDDLGQWRAYGDNGRGFALGLSPQVFRIEQKADRKPHENVFVVPVVYDRHAARRHHMPAIEQAVRIVGKTVEQASDLMQDSNVGMPFLDEMAKALIAAQLIINSLTIKHEAYQHEREVRLIILGEQTNLAPYISTRAGRSEIVPFIKSDMPVQAKDNVAEIVIGPAASAGAEDWVQALLEPFHDVPASILHRSTIPYRAN